MVISRGCCFCRLVTFICSSHLAFGVPCCLMVDSFACARPLSFLSLSLSLHDFFVTCLFWLVLFLREFFFLLFRLVSFFFTSFCTCFPVSSYVTLCNLTIFFSFLVCFRLSRQFPPHSFLNIFRFSTLRNRQLPVCLHDQQKLRRWCANQPKGNVDTCMLRATKIWNTSTMLEKWTYKMQTKKKKKSQHFLLVCLSQNRVWAGRPF